MNYVNASISNMVVIDLIFPKLNCKRSEVSDYRLSQKKFGKLQLSKFSPADLYDYIIVFLSDCEFLPQHVLKYYSEIQLSPPFLKILFQS